MSLKQYNQKRNFNKTKEPIGKKENSNKKLIFVVQHHLARKDHYDFRLEWEGVLISFAVPKGPSYNPNDKRLAVHVEDHPLSYRNFEGVIPSGEYGAGPVLIFDEGTWTLKEMNGDFNKGVIKFTLHGKRLKGSWTLTHFKENNWLLIKEEDGIHLFYDILEFDTSIRTNRIMEEIKTNKKQVKNSNTKHIVEYTTITNPQKILFSKSKTTKFDIAKYYQKVANRMLPFLKGRLLSVVRAPEGVEKTTFFKKHLEENEGLGKLDIQNSKGNKEDYYYIRTTKGIIKEVQMNTIEFHIWGSTIDDLDYPNMLVFDLDPDEKLPLQKLRTGIKDLKSILDELHLKSFLKTSGGKGYHVVVPTKKFKDWASFSEFAQNIAKLMETKWPEKYVSTMSKVKRKNKIFIDWFRNTKKSTSVAPYSIRAREKLSISMPIKWSDLDKIKPDEIDIPYALKLLKRKDPWEDF